MTPRTEPADIDYLNLLQSTVYFCSAYAFGERLPAPTVAVEALIVSTAKVASERIHC